MSLEKQKELLARQSFMLLGSCCLPRYLQRPTSSCPSPDQHLVLLVGTPAPAPRYRGLQSRQSRAQGTASLTGAASGSGRCLPGTMKSPSTLAKFYLVTAAMGWTMDSCLPSSPGAFLSGMGEVLGWATRGGGRWAGWGHWARFPPCSGSRVTGAPWAPSPAADCALGRPHRGGGGARGHFQIQLVRLWVDTGRGRRLGKLLRGGGGGAEG